MRCEHYDGWQVCYARILDSKRKFLEAALRYYELSQLEKREISGRRVDEDELQQALSAAVTCTILAAAGPQRSRVLATLYKVPSIVLNYSFNNQIDPESLYVGFICANLHCFLCKSIQGKRMTACYLRQCSILYRKA